MPSTALLSDAQRKTLILAEAVGLLVLAAGLLIAPERIWSNLFVGTFGILTVGLGGTVFLALTYVSGAGWHVAFRRVPEALSMGVPVAGAAMLVVLAVRMRQYGWHGHGEGDAGSFWFKEFWLTPWFWFLRSVTYVTLWSVFSYWLVRRSRDSHATAGVRDQVAGSVRLSALFLAVYAVTFSLASVDWIMALDPMWFSTIWGVYNFAGMVLSVLAVLVILCVRLSAPGRPLHGVFRTEHLHDLGKLLVGFSCFWMYIWFSQYMLIWYANIPEETSYFIARTRGPWGPIVVTSIILNWVVPFFVLLPQPAKRSTSVMLKVAVVLLLGRWLDLYLMVFPSTIGETPAFGLWEVAAIVCAAAAVPLLVDHYFRQAPAVAMHDPYLLESLNYNLSGSPGPKSR